MSIFDKLFKAGVKETVDSVGNVIDNLSTSDDEKSAAKNQLTEIVTTQLNKVTELQASVILAEASGNWLQRSWRPILMLSFGFIVVYSKFIAPAFNLPNTNLETSFWELLNLGMGGYVIGRSVEKVADTVTKNVDMTFLRKKDRV
jgi:hypothetical protein